MFLYSFLTPFAIFVGLMLGKVLSGHFILIVSSFLISFAAGTFIYVANMEIMAEEFASPENKWQKLALLLAGFVFMSGLGFVF